MGKAKQKPEPEELTEEEKETVAASEVAAKETQSQAATIENQHAVQRLGILEGVINGIQKKFDETIGKIPWGELTTKEKETVEKIASEPRSPERQSFLNWLDNAVGWPGPCRDDTQGSNGDTAAGAATGSKRGNDPQA